MRKKDRKSGLIFVPPFKVDALIVAMAETMDWGLTLLGVPGLWKQTKGTGVKVAVLDTGISLQHPDLADAIDKTKDFTGSRTGVSDANGHGTHTAGIIGARQNNTGIIGVAPECRLLVGKVIGDDGSGPIDALTAGIRWAVDQGADVISMSLGGPQDVPDLHDACKYAASKGVFLVAAAGNEGPSLDTEDYPALYAEVVAVGAIDRRKKVTNYSSRGATVDVVAPGDNVLSDYPPRNLARLSGTSMACPFVSGVTALMVAKHRQFGGQTDLKTIQDLKDHLHKTAEKVGGGSGHDPAYGYGIINPGALLAETVSGGSGGSGSGSVGPTLKTLALDPTDLTQSGLAKLKDFLGADSAEIRIQL